MGDCENSTRAKEGSGLIGDTVFIIQITGVEWGGAAPVAFATREAAQAWCEADHAKDSPPYAVDYYEIKEVVIQ